MRYAYHIVAVCFEALSKGKLDQRRARFYKEGNRFKKGNFFANYSMQLTQTLKFNLPKQLYDYQQ